MDDTERHAAFMSALVTEHYVLQAAASATTSEAAARASLYIYSLSSSLVAMGFASRTSEVFRPFASAVLPAVFILGLFTIARLVDTGIEYQQALRGIARIRSYYRTRRLWSGAFVALLTTAASMIAFTNSVVAGACVTLLVASLGSDRIGLGLSLGAATAVALMAGFLAYQRLRYRHF